MTWYTYVSGEPSSKLCFYNAFSSKTNVHKTNVHKTLSCEQNSRNCALLLEQNSVQTLF